MPPSGVVLFLCMGSSHKEEEIQSDHNMSLPASLPLGSLIQRATKQAATHDLSARAQATRPMRRHHTWRGAASTPSIHAAHMTGSKQSKLTQADAEHNAVPLMLSFWVHTHHTNPQCTAGLHEHPPQQQTMVGRSRACRQSKGLLACASKKPSGRTQSHWELCPQHTPHSNWLPVLELQCTTYPQCSPAYKTQWVHACSSSKQVPTVCNAA